MLARFRPYYRYLRPVRGKFIAGILFGVISGGASGGGVPWMINTGLKPLFEATGADRLGMAQIASVLALIPIVIGIRCTFQVLNHYLVALSGTVLLEGLRADLFKKLQRLHLAFFQRSRSGDLLARGTSDAQQVQQTMTTTANDLVVLPVTFLSAIGYILYSAFTKPGAAIFLLGIAVIPICVLPLKVIGKNLYRRAKQAFAASGDVSELLRENLSAVREVRAFNLQEREVSRFVAGVREFFSLQMKVTKYNASLSPLIEFIAVFGIAGSLLLAYRAQTPFNTVFAMVAALYMAYDPLRKMGKIHGEFTRGAAALDRIEQVMHEPEPIADPVAPKTLGAARGEIEFRGVSFSYGTGADEIVLRDVSVHIAPDTVVALVGPSGAGKSTFANLVPRFFEATTGQVLVDGVDVRDVRLAELRDNIALVSQDSFLFNDTIRNNLLVGRPGATPAEVEQAARDAYAHDFIVSALPQGYDTIVGERGASLSGGQRQRIALARAFLRNAPILILDEATSALDSESEAAIQKALQKLVVGKTVLMIAHRFSTLRDAHLVLVFDRGQIVARGPHAEVYRTSPLYRGLYDQQQIA
ncbi:MAG TPA: ABC transporter ATP-binding protein [Opitutaceae bacterium]|nr:ABC transporter ATP-binding protein [Opitutaceae bacterium]